ncbi:uncharacterized protein LOC111829982 [Capsella rubella]|uniref:uncharacterized protein LOC111829982 n=1 Tax=Capsella rubella TaxID=81985 RepID=UPI000CD5ABF9|nr:uncharacterized protein LOC111829982 [Capsella rubella]
MSVWTDPWIPAQFLRPAMSNGSIMDTSLQIRHLIDRQTNYWRLDMLQEHFSSEDVSLLNALQIGNWPVADFYGWHFKKNGKYTVKAGYYVARMRNLQMLISEVYITPLLAGLWKVRSPPKLQHFMWQARNDKTFNNMDKNPLEIVRLAKDEARIWHDAQAEESHPPREDPVGA